MRLLLSKMNIKNMSMMCPEFGHILDTFWAFFYGLDNKIVIQSGVRCVQNVPKFWAHYGHILGTSMPWGHILSTWLELSKLQLRV